MSDPSRTGMIAREAVSQRVLVTVDFLHFSARLETPQPLAGKDEEISRFHADVTIVNGCPQWAHVELQASQLFSRKLSGAARSVLQISAGF